ncbi:3-coathanger stack domain-containing protein [Jiulongibacter sediminis]|jgi:hypothetical protein|uniref:3-coathanger stack domain-containing protein n=1 Tax=Jiulongibacter sediminis TaxID=1605367 RepID=UPI0026EA01B8|nr:3-coathanger stack domain-containing protein [Jiulongibacter sediminis]
MKDDDFSLRLISSGSTICPNEDLYLSLESNKDFEDFFWFQNDSLFAVTKDNKLIVDNKGTYYAAISDKGKMVRSNAIQLNACASKSAIYSSQEVGINIESDGLSTCQGEKEVRLWVSGAPENSSYIWYQTDDTGNYISIPGETDSLISTTSARGYRVQVSFSGQTFYTPTLQLTPFVSAKITDEFGNLTSSTYVNSTDSVSLFIHIDGTSAPYDVSVGDLGDYTFDIRVVDSPYELKVKPEYNSIYSIRGTYMTNVCGGILRQGQRNVMVDTLTHITLDSLSKTNVCAGEMIDVYYTIHGPKSNYNNGVYAVVYHEGQGTVAKLFESPGKVLVPTWDVYLNKELSIDLFGNSPYIPFKRFNNVLKVTELGCVPEPVIRSLSGHQVCQSAYLSITSIGLSGLQYQWYKDGQQIEGETGSTLYAIDAGQYSVNVYNSTGYNSTSDPYELNFFDYESKLLFSESLSGNQLLSVEPKGEEYNYRWTFNEDGFGISEIISVGVESSLRPFFRGRYQAEVIKDFCKKRSNEIRIVDEQSLVMTLNGKEAVNTINPGDSATVEILFSSTVGPYQATVKLGLEERTFFSDHPLISFKVSPDFTTTYTIQTAKSGAGELNLENEFSEATLYVAGRSNSDFTIIPSTNLSVCQGGQFDLDLDTTGFWPEHFTLRISTGLLNGNQSGLYDWNGELPIKIELGTSYKIGDKVVVGVSKRFGNYVYRKSDFYFTVISEGCFSQEAQLQISNNENKCTISETLTAFPKNGDQYEWYRNGTLLKTSQSSYLRARFSGEYYVKVYKGNTILTSNAVQYQTAFGDDVQIFLDSNGSSNICEALGSESIKLEYHQLHPDTEVNWYAGSNGSATPQHLQGHYLDSLVIDMPGVYAVQLKKGICEYYREFQVCDLSIDFDSRVACRGSTIPVKLLFRDSYTNTADTVLLQLVDVTTKVVVDSKILMVLRKPNYNNKEFYSLNVETKDEWPVGDYQFKLVGNSGSNSVYSSGILTVFDENLTSLSISSSSDEIVSNGSVNLTLKGCEGNSVIWNTWEQKTSIKVSPQVPTKYEVLCQTLSCGVTRANRIIHEPCDSLESNDSYNHSTLIRSISDTLGIFCLDHIDDEDWFVWLDQDKPYYFRVYRNTNISVSGGTGYRIALTQNEGLIRFETLPAEPNQRMFNSIELYDSDMRTRLKQSTYKPGSSFSLLTYQTSAQGCNDYIRLHPSTFNTGSGNDYSYSAERIVGYNHISDQSSLHLKGVKAILLKPGFTTEFVEGGVFKAEMVGCP